MDILPDQLNAASEYVLSIRNGALKMVEETRVPGPIAGDACILPAIDGLVAAAAMIAEMSGIVPTARHKRFFADEVRTAILKCMKAAREEIDSLGPDGDSQFR
jgi:hypothetical protein